MIAAVLVPPSAFRTSASMWIVQGPSALRSTTAQAAADQPLDLRGSSIGSAPDARRRAAGQHGVFGGQPADRFSLEKRWYGVRKAGSNKDRRFAAAIQHATRAVTHESALDGYRAKLGRTALVGSGHVTFFFLCAGPSKRMHMVRWRWKPWV